MQAIDWRKTIGLLLVIYLPGLWLYSVPFTGDQRVYVAAAMEMWERGQILTPYLFGEPNFLKPPLLYWLILLGWKIFGFGIFGALIFELCAMIASVGLLAKIADRIGANPRWAIFFGLSIGALTFTQSAQMENMIVFFYLASSWLALEFVATRRPAWIYGAFLVAGLSSLVKSPLYAVFWVGGFSIYLLLAREFWVFKKLHSWIALILGVAVGLSWFIYAWKVHGDAFWNQYVVYESIAKKHGNGIPVWDLWGNLLFFWIPAVPWILMHFRGIRLHPSWRFVLAMGLGPAIFFSYFPYRVGTYLYILAPLGFLWIKQNPPRKLIYFAVGLALTVRIAALTLGEMDIRLLRGVVERGHPDLRVAWIDEERNVWHEVGLISVALGKPGTRFRTMEEAETFLKSAPPDQAVLILSDGQFDRYREKMEKDGGYRPLEWKRWARRVQFPADLYRGYKIVFYQPHVHEGG